MAQQRKYLDRKRRVPLNGRPIEPNWFNLLHKGFHAVENGWAEKAPYLSDVMWQGVDQQGISAQPAAFSNPLLREWLLVDEEEATTFLRNQWNNLRAPETAAEALEILASPDCLESGLGGHRLRVEHSAWETPAGTWAIGWCTDCAQVLLWLFTEDEGGCRSWPFYDHEMAGR